VEGAVASREPVRFLVFSGSLRSGSLNSVLARLAARMIAAHGGEVDEATMADFDAPSYDQDLQAEGFPPGAVEFRRRLEAVDALVIARAHEAFGPAGEIADQALASRFESTLVGFMDLVEAAKHYPCMRRAWIEFLGEPHVPPAFAATD